METEIRKGLQLPENVEKYLIGTFYDICVDDGGKHKIQIADKWMEKRLAEAGFIKTTGTAKCYPMEVDEHMVLSEEEAVNLDNVAASYAATLSRVDCMRENAILSTTDAFFRNTEGNCYLIEFKNGDWKKEDIKQKVYESRTLLDNLKELDEQAVITGNRRSEKVEVNELRLSDKMHTYFGIDGTNAFYKEKVQLLVVYSGGLNIVRKYQLLCSRKDRYSWMQEKLDEFGVGRIERKIKGEEQLQFGYSAINKLGALLLSADSANRNVDRFDAVIQMFDRIEEIEQRKPKQKKICEVLDTYPGMINYLYHRLYDGEKKANCYINDKCKGVLNTDNFLKLTAYMSLEKMFVDVDRQEKDDFTVVEEFISKLSDSVKDKFLANINEIWSENRKLPEKIVREKKLFAEDSFCDMEQLLKNENYEEAVRRSIFIRRVASAHEMKKFEDDTDCALIKNICKVEPKDAEQVVQATKDNTKHRMILFAIWSYLCDEADIRETVPNDSYRHILRQMKYLEELESEKYGRFVARINDKTKHLLGEEKKQRVNGEKEKIRQEIISGKELREMLALQMMVAYTISNEDGKIRKLKTELAGAVLKGVTGCKAIDFAKIRL